jgi:DNA polymerase-3 subunit epsilon
VSLSDVPVLVVDGQASGATPAHGDLLELGWALSDGAARSHWVVPGTERPVPRAVRELTGWSESVLPEAIAPQAAWSLLLADAPLRPMPAVIHWARFELPFLHQLHEASGTGGPFPLEVVCLHAIAERLLPDLPRRSIRGLAGHLGAGPALERRAAGHVEATRFIWRALLPRLLDAGIDSWEALRTFSATKVTRSAGRRVFPLSVEVRRRLPDAPGVYRFVRKQGDVLYVGKAASLKKRVQGHFTAARRRAPERTLEMLTQVHDVVFTETPTLLEAALLEVGEIERIDPPYNVHLRSVGRQVWFTTRAFDDPQPQPDAAHPVGPVPSRLAITGLGAMRRLLEGAELTPALAAGTVRVPERFAPELPLFSEAWAAFRPRFDPGARRPILSAARALWPYDEEVEEEDEGAIGWDLPRLTRHLERSLAGGGQLVRRAAWLCLLTDSVVEVEERGRPARRLVVRGGELDGGPGPPPVRPLSERRAVFDAARYDRLRVLSTELRRILLEGGLVRVHVGRHVLDGSRLSRIYAAL